jgi:diguanylate cyclase (GGDEF)-like protein
VASLQAIRRLNSWSGKQAVKDSVVHASVRIARRAVFVVLVTAAAVIAVLIIERNLLEREILQAADNERKAAALMSDILLADERLTMSANMAAATGERSWISRYESNIPLIDRAIAAAKQLAPPDVRERFDEETRVANDLLVVMERKSFDLDHQGRLSEARGILDSGRYAAIKRVLLDGTKRFGDGLLSQAENDLNGIAERSRLIIAFTVLLACSAFVVLWHKLNRSLASSKTAFLAAEERVQRLAMQDSLTGLPNRQHFHDELHRLLVDAARSGVAVAVVMIDLDRFKPINDRHGHGTGDDVLVEVGNLLSTTLGSDQICARIGGDEFVIASAVGPDSDEAHQVATRIIDALSAPIVVRGVAHSVGATAGISLFPENGTGVDELVRKADVALYRAKREERGGARFFRDDMDEVIRNRESMETDLRRALDAGEIIPLFQPVIDFASGSIETFEVLARWQHPTRGLLGPAHFIDAAQDLGLIDDLFLSILRRATRAAAAWPAVRLAVNLAPSQLGHAMLGTRILAVLVETGFQPARLEIEVTENALITNIDQARETVLSLKRWGIQLALDDFGIGYSSLHHLRALPFDRIKIDGSFVRAMASDNDALTIVNTIISLGRSLGLPVTAESVETPEIAGLLKAAGCKYGQGWYFGHPTGAEVAEKLLAGGRSGGRLSIVA